MDTRKKQFTMLLENVADSLDISESRFLDVEKKYKEVGKWLGKEGTSLARFRPDVYPQGSFSIGTVVKPVSQKDEYDIDIVCQLHIEKNSITPRQLRDMVEDRLRENIHYGRILDPYYRFCWTLNYAEEAPFKMDILPSIPDNKLGLLSLGVINDFAKFTLSITDMKNIEWLSSNPRGYAEWFKDRMKLLFLERKSFLALEERVSIDEVPEYRVKTSLQRAVQILKRHRDIAFKSYPGEKPSSIIITTLAAHAYNNEPDLYEALLFIVAKMSTFIQNKNGVSWISNPINPRENFASNWAENPKAEIEFRKWLDRVKTDIEKAILETGLDKVSKSLESKLGRNVLNESMVRMGELYKNKRESGNLKMATSGLLGDVGKTVKDHTFHGNKA